TDSTEILEEGTPATGDEQALRVARAFGDDVDDAVDGVGAPQRAARAADDFNAVDVIQQHVLHVPKHAGIERRVNAAAIDHDEELVGESIVEAAGADGPVVG